MRTSAGDRASLRLLTHGYYFSCALHSAVTLGLAEALAGGPRTSEELSEKLGTQLDATRRLTRFLASFGVLDVTPSGAYALSEAGSHLRADHPQSLAREVAMFAGGETFAAWGGLSSTLRSGRPAFEEQHGGKRLFDYLAGDAPTAARFHGAWHEITVAAAAETLAAYDFGGVKTITDVGGGYGVFLATLLSAHPALRGVLFDLPFSVEGAPAVFAEKGVADRVVITTGNAEESLPPMELAVIKSVIHGCDDAQSIRILRNTARALPRGGKVLVIERVIPADPGFHWSKLVDMTMMVMTGGRERTRDDYARLYAESGLALTRCIDLPSGFSLVEGVSQVGAS
jgi:hypothetical protein